MKDLLTVAGTFILMFGPFLYILFYGYPPIEIGLAIVVVLIAWFIVTELKEFTRCQH